MARNFPRPIAPTFSSIIIISKRLILFWSVIIKINISKNFPKSNNFLSLSKVVKMASFDISVDEFLSSCSTSERKEIIVAMVEDGFLPKWIIDDKGKVRKDGGKTQMEDNFVNNLEKLKSKYYSLTLEEETFFEEIFKKYL